MCYQILMKMKNSQPPPLILKSYGWSVGSCEASEPRSNPRAEFSNKLVKSIPLIDAQRLIANLAVKILKKRRPDKL